MPIRRFLQIICFVLLAGSVTCRFRRAERYTPNTDFHSSMMNVDDDDPFKTRVKTHMVPVLTTWFDIEWLPEQFDGALNCTRLVLGLTCDEMAEMFDGNFTGTVMPDYEEFPEETCINKLVQPVLSDCVDAMVNMATHEFEEYENAKTAFFNKVAGRDGIDLIATSCDDETKIQSAVSVAIDLFDSALENCPLDMSLGDTMEERFLTEGLMIDLNADFRSRLWTSDFSICSTRMAKAKVQEMSVDEKKGVKLTIHNEICPAAPLSAMIGQALTFEASPRTASCILNYILNVLDGEIGG